MVVNADALCSNVTVIRAVRVQATGCEPYTVTYPITRVYLNNHIFDNSGRSGYYIHLVSQKSY